jgi:hypothetical protein
MNARRSNSLGEKMNFVIATPEHTALQIQLQIAGLNHIGDPRCAEAWPAENLSRSCCKLARDLLRQFFGYREHAPLTLEESKKLWRHVLKRVSRRRLRHAFDCRVRLLGTRQT